MSWPADTSDFSDIWPLAVEVSGTGIWDRNVVTGEIRYSAGWFRMLGYEGIPLSNSIEVAYTRVHPDDLVYVQATMQAHFEGKTESYEVEHRLLCQDGSYKWVLSRGKVVSRDVDGNALRMTGTTTDITNIRALEAKNTGEQASAMLPVRRRNTQRRRALPDRRKPYPLEEAPTFLQRRPQSIPCFARGTTILTPRGSVAVERLAEGDAVLTVRENGPSERRVVRVGQRTFGSMVAPLPARLRPVLIRANAFGPGVPERDLRLSPDTAIFTENHLIEAKYLVNGTTVVRDTACRTVTYHHVALDAHDILLAENLPAESYLDCGGRASFADLSLTNGILVTLRPDTAAAIEAFGCAPLAEPGSDTLLKVRELLDNYATLAGYAPRRSGRVVSLLSRADQNQPDAKWPRKIGYSGAMDGAEDEEDEQDGTDD